MLWSLLLCSVFCAAMNSLLLHKLPKGSNIQLFNALCALIWLIILFSFNGFNLTFSADIVVWGVIYGIIQELFMFFKAKAMGSGSVSITTLIGNCSLLLSTTVGAIVWNESVSAIQILGIALLISAFFLCTYSKSQSDKKASGKWLFYCVCFFVLAAAVGIIFKAFSKAQGNKHTGDMMIFAAIIMILFSLIKLYFTKIIKQTDKDGTKENIFIFNKAFLSIAVISGILSCTYNRLNISLSGLFDSVIFYPCFNGGVILLSALLSIIFLREKLTLRQSAGLALGLISVVVIGIF